MIPRTMTASHLDAVSTVRLADVPVPTVAPLQVLVELRAVGVCGSDVHYFDHGHIGNYVPDGPMILGHEASGVVVAVGEGVSPLRLGERVSLEPQRSCRRCLQCKAGRYNLCPEVTFLATPPYDGAFTQYLPSTKTPPTPFLTTSLSRPALCEPLSVGIWAVQKAQLGVSARVLISRAGPIGIITSPVARSIGATDILVSDPQEARRDAALRFGTTRVINPEDEDMVSVAAEVDAFIEASGSPRALAAGIHAGAPAGRVVFLGSGVVSAELPIARIQARELQVTGGSVTPTPGPTR